MKSETLTEKEVTELTEALRLLPELGILFTPAGPVRCTRLPEGVNDAEIGTMPCFTCALLALRARKQVCPFFVACSACNRPDRLSVRFVKAHLEQGYVGVDEQGGLRVHLTNNETIKSWGLTRPALDAAVKSGRKLKGCRWVKNTPAAETNENM